MNPSSGGFLVTGVNSAGWSYDQAVELEIDPEPDEAQRGAILAALEVATTPAPALDAWRAAALREGVEEPADP